MEASRGLWVMVGRIGRGDHSFSCIVAPAAVAKRAVSQITARVGFSQGHVSACIARLRELGRVETPTDRAERRRTLVSLTPSTESRIRERIQSGSAEELLSGLLQGGDLSEMRRAVSVLDALNQRLIAPVAGRSSASSPRFGAARR
jgi:DNA-binding MarR family transcriptional regulator